MKVHPRYTRHPRDTLHYRPEGVLKNFLHLELEPQILSSRDLETLPISPYAQRRRRRCWRPHLVALCIGCAPPYLWPQWQRFYDEYAVGCVHIASYGKSMQTLCLSNVQKLSVFVYDPYFTWKQLKLLRSFCFFGQPKVRNPCVGSPQSRWTSLMAPG